MRYWVLKLSRDSSLAPSKWLRRGAITRDGTNHQLTKKRPDPGDRCFYWQPSPHKRLVGLGTVLRVRKNKDGRLVVTSRADTGELMPGITLDALRSIPSLRAEAFLNPGYSATFYGIGQPTASLLYHLVGIAVPLYSKAWVHGPDATSTAVARKATQIVLGTLRASPTKAPSRQADTKQLQARIVRAGQGPFRANLLAATGGRCEMSGCSVVDALDACHIRPHRDGGDYSLSNGMLLRTDLHALVDVGLLSVDPDSMTIRCAEGLKGTEYWKWNSKPLRPRLDGSAPSAKHLRKYWR